MKRILAHRDHVFHDVLVALIDARATHMSVQPDPYSGMSRSGVIVFRMYTNSLVCLISRAIFKRL